MNNTERKTERLYLDSWGYNAARILTALAVVVENNGGEIVYSKYSSNYLLTNRSISGNILENEEKIEHAKNNKSDNSEFADKLDKYIARLEQENAELREKYHDEMEIPILCTHKSYINFTLDGDYYNYNLDDNPFFPFHYWKYKVKDGKYDANMLGEEDNKEWLYDCCFFRGMSQGDVVEIANLIFNFLCKARYSNPVREKIRVPNYYDNRYHYEYKHTEKMRKIGEF